MTEINTRYDEKYEIRLATAEDIDMIMKFIDTEWRKEHILATNRHFFEFEFLEDDGTVNIVIAIDRTKHTLEGMIGFLKASHDKDHMDIWGSVWKVRDGAMALLGIELIKRRIILSKCRYDLGIGDDPNTAIPLFKILMQRKTGKMNQYYMLADREDFKIAKITHKSQNNFSVTSKQSVEVIRFESIEHLKENYDLTKNKETVPYKDEWYINHRFFNHIIYKYNVYGIKIDNKVEAIFVTRDQPYEDRIAVRVVDFIGNQSAFGFTAPFWRKLLADGQCEYADIYCLGFEDKYIKMAGFKLRDEDDTNIIPNYFAPFVQENIDIWVNSTMDKTLFCKADGDQDRPN